MRRREKWRECAILTSIAAGTVYNILSAQTRQPSLAPAIRRIITRLSMRSSKASNAVLIQTPQAAAVPASHAFLANLRMWLNVGSGNFGNSEDDHIPVRNRFAKKCLTTA
jgi:hypothetical protein